MKSPSASDRATWSARVGDRDLHRGLLHTLSCLHECEGKGSSVAPLNGWVRVVTWNVQRGRRPAELAALLATTGADIAMLSELDSGMARTRNDDVPNLLADALGAGYTYGVEFVELSLGDELERRAAAGTENARGLHGNAIVSPAELIEPRVVRLPDSEPRWFAADSTQPRVGGRMAVLATVAIDGLPVQVASTHLENRTDGEHRAEQMEVLLSAVDERAGGGPAVVGGDLNTLGTASADLFDRSIQRTLRAADPARFTWPVAYEPLFEVAAAHNFTWIDANDQAGLAARARARGAPTRRRPCRPPV